MKVLRWTVIVTAILLSLAVILWKPVMHFVFHDLPFMGESFDRKAWLSALGCMNSRDCLDRENACLRGPMYRDLRKNNLLPGTPRANVIELLGEPDQMAPDNCFDYELGYCSGLKVDTDFLRVCFDEKEKLERVLHWQS